MKQRGLSGGTLKIIAIITMFTDHVAAAVIARILRGAASMTDGQMEVLLRKNAGALGGLLAGWLETGALYDIYAVMRDIGRIAFPIFCFLLVEGFMHTRNRWKYLWRLGLFAILSEIPFDLAFSSRVLETGYQNIYFTLFLGMLTMILYHKIEEQVRWNVWMRTFAGMVVLFAGMGMAELLRTDYGAKGVMCIMVLYVFRQYRMLQVAAGALSFFWWELPAVLAFIPIASYNGKRGLNLKYFFYIFYPAHLLLFYLICRGMGIAGIAAL